MKKTSSSRRVAPLVLALATTAAMIVGFPAPLAFGQQRYTAGDVAQARELFNEGMRQRDKGDLEGALEKLKAAHALAETPITAVELGRTYLATGRLVEAREVLLSVGRIAPQHAETSHSTAARTESAALAEQIRPRIPSITVKITGVQPESVAVTIDGAAVPREALLAPRLVNPGAHSVVATSTSGGTAEARLDLKEGEARSVELKIVLLPSTASAPTPATPAEVSPVTPSGAPSRGLGPLVYAGFGTAAAGIVVGTVTGLMSLSRASAVSGACDGTTCPRSVDGDLQSGRTLGTVSTAAFIVAGAGAALGVVGLLVRPHDEAVLPATTSSVTPWIGPGYAGLSGRF